MSRSKTLWLWHGWSFVLTLAYAAFTFVGITIFEVLVAVEQQPWLTRLMAASFPFWLIAGFGSWLGSAMMANRSFERLGTVGLVMPVLWHLSWILFSVFAIAAGLLAPTFTVAHVVI